MNKSICPLVFYSEIKSSPQIQLLQTKLQEKDDKPKIKAMKQILMLMLNGEVMPKNMLMMIFQYVSPSKNHELKKLFLLYLELIEKKGPDNKLRSEMYLICNYLRNDINHPNEFIRGSTLRFLCKIHEPEIVEPLISSIRDDLTYSVPYVRKNAVLLVAFIYKNHPQLIPDAPEVIENFLKNESDPSCQKNAFIMLYEIEQNRAMNYLLTMAKNLINFDESMQLVSLELMIKICENNPKARTKFLKSILSLLESKSNSVKFEASKSLILLSNSQVAIRAATQALCKILAEEKDNNIRIIVLSHLNKLRINYSHIVSDFLLDILSVLSSSSFEIKSEIIFLAEDLVDTKNIEGVILLLKKEIGKTGEIEHEKTETTNYLRLLVGLTHKFVLKFPQVSDKILDILIDLILRTPKDSSQDQEDESSILIRDIMETRKDIREQILQRLFAVASSVGSSFALRTILWIFGEYCENSQLIRQAFEIIKNPINDLKAILDQKVEEQKSKEESKKKKKEKSSQKNENVENLEVKKEKKQSNKTSKNRRQTKQTSQEKKAIMTKTTSSNTQIRKDGTYGTVGVSSPKKTAISINSTISTVSNTNKITNFIMEGNSYLLSTISSSITKMTLKLIKIQGESNKTTKDFVVDSMLLLVFLLKIGKSNLVKHQIDPDSEQKIFLNIKILGDPKNEITKILLEDCRNSLSKMIKAQQEGDGDHLNDAMSEKFNIESQPDDLIVFNIFQKNRISEKLHFENQDQSLKSVLDFQNDEKPEGSDISDVLLKEGKFNKVFPLTGFSDPIFVEAILNINLYDLMIDFYIKNLTESTFQNMTLELYGLGGLELIDKQQSFTLGPLSSTHITVMAKVSSTENRGIAGTISYDISGTYSAEKNCIVLNEIKISGLDYLIPTSVSLFNFRKMWVEFQWENKILISTSITDLEEYLDFITKKTNMKIVDELITDYKETGFVSKNLYAKTIFGEDVVANASFEKNSDGKITGYVRIRSHSQGLAICVGTLLN
ncbi:coatomer subunit beta [Anaeramoeba ignava]|uniref:Coatomer subunit beta n=1 Tax=Anaeramoeba ignava TaxID=1746090 RepID=A0A9Q0R9E4_ANAIG|nr:coatomer subunit beta [Anaeramoeba ignava]